MQTIVVDDRVDCEDAGRATDNVSTALTLAQSFTSVIHAVKKIDRNKPI